MENYYCEVCSVQLMDHTQFVNHLSGTNHLREVQFNKFKEWVERSIFIPCLPKNCTKYKLMDFFVNFGPIAKLRINKDWAIIEFKKREPTEDLINKPIWLNNPKLNIPKRIFYNNETTKIIDLDSIKSIFNNETTFEIQLETFLNTVLLNDKEIEERYDSICKFLDEIFASEFPKCRFVRFGSTRMGLAFKDCDLDVYLDNDEPICESERRCKTEMLFSKLEPVMKKLNYIFKNILLTLEDKNPIKFYFVPNKVSCHMSFKNDFAIHKSYYINYCLLLDRRIRPLMVIIKFWARQSKTTGNGKISNYTLLLLIIFYLQQPETRILPSLLELQKTCRPKFVHCFQVNFDINTVLLPINNRSTIPQLLTGFFNYYANFYFNTIIICPKRGMAYSNALIREIDTSRMPYYMYVDFKFMQTICKEKANAYIQDPIELNDNCFDSISKKDIATFKKNCKISAEICNSSQENNYKNLLENLFTYEDYVI
ncbi:PREDICTED: speckle targeted PIP5K1A-regulated poly(A) polymerase-like isoform X2 [Polistes dominula]|uniref:Speckle targeted PIP5K1A-regulated poly(A) polymerase n=1 Tax=Polistes dominula TaxID=743375 RepID=A0ABM1J3S0_POLDO|nr:PREDICTED: speckle targeted PIP5K1A-regulated poly(A) polymerase-like isoform X2 [Polistes dominula]